MMAWHRHTVDVAMEYDPITGRLIYDEVIVTVMRQCGKTLGLITPVMVHRVTKVPHRLGRQRVAFLMHQRDKSRAKLEKDIIPLLAEADESFTRIEHTRAKPSRLTYEWKSSLNNGFEHLLFGKGNYLGLDTPSKKAGHSDTLDLYAFDEIRFAVNDQVEQGADPTMITRRDRQAWKSSTAGDHESLYMWPLVVSGRELVVAQQTALESGVPHPSRTCYIEYSIPDECDLHDPDVWRTYQPALKDETGAGTIALEDIFAKLERAENHPDESKIDGFRNEYANQWVTHPRLSSEGRIWIIPEGVWSTRVAGSRAMVAPFTLGVDVSPDGRSAAIGLAGHNAVTGKIQVRVLDLYDGTNWLEKRIADRRDEHGPEAIAYDDGNPSTKALAPDIGRAAGTVPVMPFNGAKYTAACEAFRLAFVENRACHEDQAWLNSALEGASKKMRGSAWLWDRQSALADIAPLPALTCAVRALETLPDDDDEDTWAGAA